MPTTATLQSFMTKNNFQALALGEDIGKRPSKDLALSGIGERPWDDLALSGTTSIPDLKNGLERKVVEDLRRPSASGHDTTRHDTTRHDHDTTGSSSSKPRRTVSDFMQTRKNTDLQCAITEAENIVQSINVLQYTASPAPLCAVEPHVVKVRVALDSAACDNVIDPKELPNDAEWEPNETGKHFVGANESPIERFGSCKTIMSSKHGRVGCNWQMAAVSRALHSVGIVAGPKGGPGKQDVLFDNDNAYVVAPGVVKAMMKHLKAVAEYEREGNLYVGEVSLSSFTRQGNAE
jgi:hypothetical protein